MRHRWAIIAVAAPLASLLVGQTGWSAAPPAGTPVTVQVDTHQRLATVPSTAIGINASTYDGAVTDAAVPGLLNGIGARVIRFPGGTESDQYNWKTDTDVLFNTHEATDFDHFMSVLGQTRAQAMITVNYGTGNTIGTHEATQETGAQVAADWVYYANVLHHYNIRYWEIGNEIYGNDTYGAFWEPDDHCGTGTVPPSAQPSNCGPAVYASGVTQYAQAMKAVDPGISIGVVLTAPNNWPDGITAAGSPLPWDQTVLPALGNSIGFADVHWYPQNPSNVTPPGPTDAGLLASTSRIPGMVSTLRAEFAQYTGNPNIPIMITETNSVSSNPGKQTLSVVNALFLNQDYLGWLQNGVANVDWWQLHNGIVTSGDNGPTPTNPTAPVLAGTANYGEYGVLSDATCGTTPPTAVPPSTNVCEPAADTPFPAYYGLKALHEFVRPADALLATTSSQPLVQAYSVRAPDGRLRVLLVNDDPSVTYRVNLRYAGRAPESARPTVFTLTGDGTSFTKSTQGTATTQTLPPYSLIVVEPRA